MRPLHSFTTLLYFNVNFTVPTLVTKVLSPSSLPKQTSGSFCTPPYQNKLLPYITTFSGQRRISIDIRKRSSRNARPWTDKLEAERCLRRTQSLPHHIVPDSPSRLAPRRLQSPRPQRPVACRGYHSPLLRGADFQGDGALDELELKPLGVPNGTWGGEETGRELTSSVVVGQQYY